MFKVLLSGALLLVLFLSSGQSGSINSGVVKAFHRQMVSLVD